MLHPGTSSWCQELYPQYIWNSWGSRNKTAPETGGGVGSAGSSVWAIWKQSHCQVAACVSVGLINKQGAKAEVAADNKICGRTNKATIGSYISSPFLHRAQSSRQGSSFPPHFGLTTTLWDTWGRQRVQLEQGLHAGTEALNLGLPMCSSNTLTFTPHWLSITVTVGWNWKLGISSSPRKLMQAINTNRERLY